MGRIICSPQTFLSDPAQIKLRELLSTLFADPDCQKIAVEVEQFLHNNILPIEDFPLIENSYSRTILQRNRNGFEAMAARWDCNTLSSIHGHPRFILYFVITGCLRIVNYKKDGEGLQKTTTEVLKESQYFSFIGQKTRFDNNIHQVNAIEETLSIHISSDDAIKGEVFSQSQVHP